MAKQFPIFKSNTARSTPFDNSTNGMTATNVQDAIEETNTLANAERYLIISATNSNVNAVKYLEFFHSIPSNQVPFYVVGSLTLRTITISSNLNSTATFTVYKNAVSVATISLSNQSHNYITGLSVDFTTGDKISTAITSGSANSPMMVLTLQNRVI